MNLSSSTFRLRRKRSFFFFFLRKQKEYKVHWREKEIMDILVTEHFLLKGSKLVTLKVMFKNGQVESYKNEQVLCENDEGNFRHNRILL